MAQMKPNSVAVLTLMIFILSADSTLPFAQHRDIFYLSGADQGKHFIAISDAPYEHQREMIFLKETNDIAIWEGEN
jgi:Xaa-Pro aminopeptidase